ncbi:MULTISPECIES: 2-dehydro-3-deoxygalactonokinase [Achromobacter]|jgi:2-dehydro-3-deoxygalactonokinase|uniref:2-dehydro-3-deoxygalactonokinase n=3 Tax=Achromobacter aegrifaciens TaxID=1287736 RepID=A0AAD2J6J3_ACHAE|nr:MULTISPECIES: 2-dehydro-3-deoxygalactonokinase [Achromobacter]MBD9430450.1 2-dehydro-3-deoxygalactonokinase [Achromobacter sp. ACM03]MBD9471982.1 2-dehydro-3-deoxygalactonokinase [Achromobacter sp. ACM01]MDR7947014.1 2-dehydro-3-deoxygalactonokinase [Achromobacter aegrifaciens]RIJ03260.1 2-dehydro-3-deoxygalactonokinase [Achromobacter sp. K91]CAB3627239.1 putative 2-dehydro-3-deoxygalactonokinase DgoK1 [Achromobacter aegrifaciens]
MTTGSPARAALIALDWGTSSLRAYRLDAAGRTLDTRHLPWGIMRLPQPLQDGAATTALSGFELAFEQACGDWLRAEPALPVIACGMVGSAQGWKEAAYLDVPVDLQRIGTLLTKVEREDGPALHIVPGLIQRHGLPNVIRGEETQVVGVMADQATRSADSVLIGLPGTHSKWVSARRGRVTHFDTFMTGEVYAALRGHTILGRTMADAASADMAAFERGLKVAGAPAGRAGVLSTIFSTRALGLTGELAPESQADYLSGLLIGHEIAALADMLQQQGELPRIVLCGDPALCRRYIQAMQHYGLGTPEQAQNATERGLWHLAICAGLIASPPTE